MYVGATAISYFSGSIFQLKSPNRWGTVDESGDMVKGVVGEESRCKAVEGRLAEAGVQSEVGLVIGRISGSLDRGFLYDLVPTPANDAGEAACSVVESARDVKKKGGKGKGQAESAVGLRIDNDWIAEHARQVSRMLLGGMKVVGIYIWISESAFKSSANMLYQTLKGVATATPLSEANSEERLLVHISFSPRRWACRNCIITSSIMSSNLCPCDFKMGSVMNSLLTFRSTYNFDVRLPICLETSCDAMTMTDALRQLTSGLFKELKDAKAVVNGNLVADDELCNSDGVHDVEFLNAFMKDTYAQDHSQKEVVGILHFSGCVCSYAYLNSKEPMSEALAEIKSDIIKSLQSRLDIICDEANGDLSPAVEGQELETEKHVGLISLQSARKGINLALPRRVFVPWLAGTFICDYLQSSETMEEIKDHCVELMSMEAPADLTSVLLPETIPHVFSVRSFWDVANQLDTSKLVGSVDNASKPEESGAVNKQANALVMSIVAAVFFLFVALFVGFLLFHSAPAPFG